MGPVVSVVVTVWTNLFGGVLRCIPWIPTGAAGANGLSAQGPCRPPNIGWEVGALVVTAPGSSFVTYVLPAQAPQAVDLPAKAGRLSPTRFKVCGAGSGCRFLVRRKRGWVGPMFTNCPPAPTPHRPAPDGRNF